MSERKTRSDGTPIARLQNKVTPEEAQQIIEMKMARMPQQQICAVLNRHPRTIKKVWEKHLDAIAKERAGQNERQRIIALQRLDQVAIDARHGALRARRDQNEQAEIRFLSLEEKTILDMARLDGLQVDKVEVSGTVGVLAVHITEQVDYEPDGVIDVTPDDD